VTASVLDIESDAHTVLFPATVSDRGSGNYEVRRQQIRCRSSPGDSTVTAPGTTRIRRAGEG
jgi:hypothetical protein